MSATEKGLQMTANDQPDAAELERYNIVRVPSDTFTWNGYRYTHVRDALAAARRAAGK